MVDPKTGQYGFSDYVQREETHINPTVYDFNKLTLRLPVCECIQ